MEIALKFTDWLMENCELASDNSLWSLNGEDYTNEKLFKIFLNRTKSIECLHKNQTQHFSDAFGPYRSCLDCGKDL